MIPKWLKQQSGKRKINRSTYVVNAMSVVQLLNVWVNVNYSSLYVVTAGAVVWYTRARVCVCVCVVCAYSGSIWFHFGWALVHFATCVIISSRAAVWYVTMRVCYCSSLVLYVCVCAWTIGEAPYAIAGPFGSVFTPSGLRGTLTIENHWPVGYYDDIINIRCGADTETGCVSLYVYVELWAGLEPDVKPEQ